MEQMLRANEKASKTQFFDQFLFVDGLTNRSIALKQIRGKSKRKSTKTQRQAIAEQHQLKQLDQCINLLKSTAHFKKQNLRQKIFGTNSLESSRYSSSLQGQETLRKKRIIRTLLKDTLTQRSKLQFQQYLSTPAYRLDQDLIQLVTKKHIPICKQNVAKIVDTLQFRESSDFLPKGEKPIDIQKQPFVERLSSFQKQMQREIKQKIRKTGLFLVESEESLQNNQHFQSMKIKNPFLQSRKHIENIKKIQWQTASLNNSQIKRKPRVKEWQNVNVSIKKVVEELFSAVKSKQLSDVEVIAAKNPKEVLKGRDQQGNNLLHVCAELNKGLIFQWLLRMRGIQALLQKNIDGQTPVSIAVNLGHRQILTYIPQSLI